MHKQNQCSGSPDAAQRIVPPIMRIPREVRGIIFNKLPQHEMVCLRYVCQAWRTEVDDFCEFSVILDDRHPRWLGRLSQLRIRKCKVVHLLERLPTMEAEEGGGDRFFQYPTLLRSLKIITEDMLKENISPENFYILLKDTSPHIREFSGMLSLPLLQYPGYPAEFPLRFDNLRKLRLSVCTMPNNNDVPIMGPPKFQDQLFHKVFSSLMKNIKMVAVQIRCLGTPQSSQLSSHVLAFMANHYKTLEHVDFDLVQSSHGMPPSYNEVRPLNQSDLERIDFDNLKKCNSFQSLRIVNSTAVGVDIWQNILAKQKKLNFLETDILPAPSQLFKQIILNNENTLVHIDIGDLTIDLEDEDENGRRFDCAVFQNCRHLRKLTLDRNTLRRRPPGGLHAELINLQCLPEYLDELNINYFLVLSDELLILFGGVGAKENMKSLSLTQCGDEGEFGVDGTVLEKVISLKSITFIEISPLNFTYPEERQRLNQILTTFGFNENHSYFQLSRVSQNFQINFDDFNP